MSGPPPSYQETVGQPQPGFPAGGYQGYAANPPGAYPPPGAAGKPQGPYPAGAAYPPGGVPPPAGSVPSYQHYQITVQQPPQQQVVVVGGCPSCRVGVLETDYTCLGVLCAILFFPIGILCCLAMTQRRCSNCGATYG